MKLNVLYVPSYSPKKNFTITPLENRLKDYVYRKFLVNSWNSAPQAQGEFSFDQYINLIQRIIINFINSNEPESIRIIGASFGGGVVHKVLSDIDSKFSIKIFLYKPILVSRIKEISKIENFKILELPQEFPAKNQFSISFHKIYYVLGDKDSLTGKPENLFNSIDYSKLFILLNSTHSSKKDEFLEFEDFFTKFIS